jgi:hypothetical protein
VIACPATTPAAAAIDSTLEDCIRRARAEGSALEDVLQRLGPASFCFVCLLLSAPFLQPIPLGPYTMAGAVTFIACGWQMIRGRQTPLLPKAMRSARLHGKGWVATLLLCQRGLRLARKFSRPRQEIWVTGRSGEHLVGWLILTGGVLLAVPVANLPFNNTFPALMIIFAAIAWLERDGAMVIVSLACGVLSVAYFATVGILVWIFGAQIFSWIKPLLPG